MTQIIRFLFYISMSFLFCTVGHAQQQDSVTISGRVTNFNGQPIDSCSVCWYTPRFNPVSEGITNKDGYYTVRVPKGKYQSVYAIYYPTYAHTALKLGLPEAEHRLEFWAWDFIADRDTTLNIRYHRMEAYGIRAFRIPGAMPAYQIYVRPMSLTRFYEWMKTSEPASIVRNEDLSNKKQQAQSKEAKVDQWAPPIDQLKVVVWIDGEEVPILMKQEIFQKCTFFSGKGKRRITYTGFPCACIKNDAATFQTDVFLNKFSTGEAADSGFQFFKMKRFGEIIIGAKIQSFYFVLNLSTGGKDQNRCDAVRCTELLQNVKTVCSRKIQVQKNQIVAFCHT